jgi:hypothetical protein
LVDDLMLTAGLRRGVMLVGAALLVVSCTPDTDSTPLPTKAPGDLVCDFVSKQSATTALGTTKFSVYGLTQDLSGVTRNKDGSKLNLAGCSFSTKAVGDALKISVEQLGSSPYDDSDVTAALAAGKSTFVFPSDEGAGYAQAGGQGEGAAVAQLIRGDWRYFVKIVPKVEGRDSVADAVALLRQVVNQLGLPRSEHLPRPAATPTR